MREICRYMHNSWKRCEKVAVSDGWCTVHNPKNAAAYERGNRTWRLTHG